MYKNKPLDFLNKIVWNGTLKNSIFKQEQNTLTNSPEWVIINLWLLNVGEIKIYFDISVINVSNQTVYEMYHSIYPYFKCPIYRLIKKNPEGYTAICNELMDVFLSD